MFGFSRRQADKVVNEIVEACAKLAESHARCGCGRDDCYSDNIPRAIAADIRTLKK